MEILNYIIDNPAIAFVYSLITVVAIFLFSDVLKSPDTKKCKCKSCKCKK